ncbi:P-loop containing nucleoside triphosphate hydrolase protein [Thozetella sp. PMI_491]|nr:P-loop containing nucleoside triphosphate hydrolase protein [Thozetella sp. PMI_491]
MYARYIPPVKPRPQPRAAVAQTQANGADGAGTNYGSSADSYQRHEPPSKIVFNDDDFPLPEPKKRKRGREEDKSFNDKRPHESDDEERIPKDKSSKKARKSHKTKSEGSKSVKKGEAPDESIIQDALPHVNDSDAMDIDATILLDSTHQNPPEANSAANAAESNERGPKKSEKKEKKKAKRAAVNDDKDDAEVYERHKSIFEKRDKTINMAQPKPADDSEEDTTQTPEELHGLEPLPQPARIVPEDPKLEYETLPPWLAAPIQVSSKLRKPFSDLGIAPEVAKVLAAQGIEEAFAVQTAALPLLLPSADRQGDVVISAATGSGKTLAYVLPMVRDISLGMQTALRGIIVLPTRDLVDQVRKACEACSAAFASGGGKRVIIGEALGRNEFKKEQTRIMEERQRYDPAGYEKYLRSRASIVALDDNDSEDDSYSLRRTAQPLPGHVIEYLSAVDILICTPGRLVEHIHHTPGFTLDYVRWLVVDEADKLLAQHFQDWLPLVVEKLAIIRPGARDFPGSNKSGVRKVVLSATMTRDISLINNLKLSRPKLIVVDAELKLPDLLKESAIRIREPSLKPLYLVDLLAKLSSEGPTNGGESQTADESDSDDSDSSDSSSESSDSDDSLPPRSRKSGQATSGARFNTSALVFTRSAEAALRLSRLLAILSPELAPFIGTLASATRSAERERTIRNFAQGKTRILIASDLVSRGIDLPNLDHVINYDIPINATAYVHRVGRTARAGRVGHAWTLLAHAEAYTFWTEFGGEAKAHGANKISRGTKVERVRLRDADDEFAQTRLDAYEAALAQLGQEAGEGR